MERGVFFPHHPWGPGSVTSPKRNFIFRLGSEAPDAVIWGVGTPTLGPAELRCFICEVTSRGSDCLILGKLL